jgi:hypothetical protein
LAVIFFHRLHLTDTPRSPQVALRNQVPGRIWIRVFTSHFAFTRPNLALYC